MKPRRDYFVLPPPLLFSPPTAHLLHDQGIHQVAPPSPEDACGGLRDVDVRVHHPVQLPLQQGEEVLPGHQVRGGSLRGGGRRGGERGGSRKGR